MGNLQSVFPPTTTQSLHEPSKSVQKSLQLIELTSQLGEVSSLAETTWKLVSKSLRGH